MKTSLTTTVLVVCVCGFTSVWAQAQQRNPVDFSFPALGATAQRHVEVAWNRFYDCDGLEGILARLNQAFPELTKLYAIGQSTEGRTLWCLEVTAYAHGNPDRKAGMYIDGNIHGNEVQAGEVVAYTAWYLCHQYGKLKQVTALLDNRVFYLVPTINPDGRDAWLHGAHSAHSSRTGVEPIDNDQDGLADEDDTDDLNGDGSITQMRIADPYGKYKPHPDYPEHLMVRVKPGEQGQYRLLGSEGIDNDQDGHINEDGRGGYDLNRNWAYQWQPNYLQRGALDYPFSQPETRAVSQFILKHPNIAAGQSYHNAGGMILRGPGVEGGTMRSEDERILIRIAEQGEKILPYYRSMNVAKDLYSVSGGEFDWFYGARGMLAFSNELWTNKNLYKNENRPSQDEQAAFMKHVLLGEGTVPWEPYDHPTYGPIEIGGTRKEWGRVPVSFLLEEELHRNMAFTLYHADQMPLLRIVDIETEHLADKLYAIWISIENQRLMPTRSMQDRTEHICAPDTVSLTGPSLKVLSAGKVQDRFFKKVEAVKRRPHRVELDRIEGYSVTRIRFVVSGSGTFRVVMDSVKGGLLQETGQIP
ncbi:M14 family metallopeptidase [Planctomycetota bacterium]